MKFKKIFANINEQLLQYISSVLTGVLAISWIVSYLLFYFHVKINIYIIITYVLFLSIIMKIIIFFLYKKIDIYDKNQIIDCCNDKLNTLIEIKVNPLNYFNLISLQQLLDYEKTVQEEVWILSADLKPEKNLLIQKIMKENMSNGKKYIYFLPDIKEFRVEVTRLFREYKNFKECINVYYLNTEKNSFLLSNFDVMIIDPFTQQRNGYCNVGADDKYNNNIYRKMSNYEIDTIINNLMIIKNFNEEK